MNAALPEGLLEEVDLGSGRGGKPGEPLTLSVVRSLTREDLPAILDPPKGLGSLPGVKNLRYSHHRLAELLVKGTPATEISLITGYTPSYISNIQNDPAFAELMAYYQTQREVIFVDALERVKALGIDATERLHDKLRDETEEWSRRELMELVDMTVVKPSQAAKGGGATPGPQVSLEVKFVGARATPVLDVEARDVTPALLPEHR